MLDINKFTRRSGRLVGENGNVVNEADLLAGAAVSLITNKTTTGTGAASPVGAFKTLRLEAWGTGTFSLQVLGIMDSGTGYPLQIWDPKNKAFITSITAPGYYDVDVQGFTSVQANVTAITGGNVNASGRLMA